MDYTQHQARLVRKGAVSKTVTITHPNGQVVAQPVRCWSVIGGTEEYELSDGSTVVINTRARKGERHEQQ